MKALVYHDVDNVAVEDVPEPEILEPTDAIVEITATAVCGIDHQLVRGIIPGMKPGTILGHEAVGIVVDVGDDVHNFRRGDRVVISSTIACGACSYCRDGYFAQCDYANPHGRRGGTAMFGGPKSTGAYDGLQAEYARVPFANVGLEKLPDELTNEQAIVLSDIFPCGFFGAQLAEVTPGDVVAVYGCGPVGQFAILSAFMLGAGRVLAIDNDPLRLRIAREQGAEAIDFDEVNVVQAVLDLTRGIGPDRAIDAVGASAESPKASTDGSLAGDRMARIERQRSQVYDDSMDDESQAVAEPMQALYWAVESIAKSGTLAIVGTYPPRFESFPLGRAFDRNLTIKSGICHHRRYIPQLMQMMSSGSIDPMRILPKRVRPIAASEAFSSFGADSLGWSYVESFTS
jgi:threonine dehydrogenase-like Zn-dependent dehydrogenase